MPSRINLSLPTDAVSVNDEWRMARQPSLEKGARADYDGIKPCAGAGTLVPATSHELYDAPIRARRI
jgi:hypothetical protein